MVDEDFPQQYQPSFCHLDCKRLNHLQRTVHCESFCMMNDDRDNMISDGNQNGGSLRVSCCKDTQNCDHDVLNHVGYKDDDTSAGAECVDQQRCLGTDMTCSQIVDMSLDTDCQWWVVVDYSYLGAFVSAYWDAVGNQGPSN